MVTPTSTPPRLLMIEDDHRLAAMVSSYLQQNGFTVDLSETAQDGLARLAQAATTAPYALVLLDLMLPDADGLAVCAKIRAQPGPTGATPVLMLTAKGDPVDRVVGLELGADDYLGKPFEPRELVARLRAVLRRPALAMAGAPGAPGTSVVSPEPRLLQFGRLQIDLDAHSLSIDGRPRVVTPYQFALLCAMAARAGRVLSRDQLLTLVTDEPPDAFDRSIDIQIGRLRAVIEDDPKQPRRILTVRGAGYVFAKLQDG